MLVLCAGSGSCQETASTLAWVGPHAVGLTKNGLAPASGAPLVCWQGALAQSVASIRETTAGKAPSTLGRLIVAESMPKSPELRSDTAIGSGPGGLAGTCEVPRRAG